MTMQRSSWAEKRGKLKDSVQQYYVDANGCWRWRGRTSTHGYGRVGDRFAHRLYYTHFIGPIPKNMQVQHICDVRDCVNPSHLKLGTDTDNAKDCVERQRTSRGDKNGRAKLTKAQAQRLRRLKGRISVRKAAKLFGLSHTSVWHLWSGKHWKHLL